MPNRLSRFADGVMEAAWLLALIVAPLFFNIYSSRVFEPDKIALVRSLALAALAAWLVKLAAEGGPRYENVPAGWWRTRAGWRQLPLLAPVAALTVAYLVSTALSIAPNISLFGSYQRLQGTFSTFSYLALFAVVAANLRRRAQVERLITVVVITSLPISVYGLLQRYRLDPLPWGGDTVERVTGHMGNAIFLAAYLIMAAMLVLGRLVTAFRAVMTSSERLPLHTARAAVYVFIFAVNLVAIWFTQSRGPQLGLLAGLFFFFVLLALHYRQRWLVITTIALGAAAGAFILALNIPNTPLSPLAEVRGLNRLARVFDEIQGNTGTGRVRVLIWTGVVEMMTPHAPLETPDGQPDVWNAFRPLVGYGPEAMLIGYNRFYPPELGQLEARNASPDRSHNETFDALAFTGVLGLLAQLSLFVLIFYLSLKWLGLITSPTSRNVFLGLVLGGGLVSTVGFVAWQGPQFFGVSLPFGMVLGLIVFLALYALRPRASDEPEPPALETWRALTLISLFAAIVAHFTEIHFGIAIASTRTHFWVFLGVMLVLGHLLPPDRAAAPEPPPPGATASKTARAGRRRAAEAGRSGPADELFTPAGLAVGMTAPVLLTLGFNYINNPSRSTDALTVIANALTLLPMSGGNRPSFGILGLVLLAWLMGGALAYIEEGRETLRAAAPTRWLAGLAAALGLTFLVTALAWLLHAGLLVQIAGVVPQTIEELRASVGMVAGVLTLYYGLLLALGLSWSWVLTLDRPAPARARSGPSGAAWLTAVALPLVAVLASVNLNLQVIQADVIYKTGLQLDEQGQPQAAIPLFQETLRLAPSQDFYYLFLGRSYLNASGAVAAEQRDALFRTAEAELQKARRLNPLNTDHTANLARLNRQWALLTTDAALRADRARQSDEFYRQATRLSPNNAGLWNEWGLLALQLLDDPAAAQAHLEQSLALDPEFDQTYWYLGDLYQTLARRAGDAAEQKALYDKALEAYQQGITVGQAGRSTSALNLRLGMASVYVATQQTQPAIDAYLQVAQLNAGVNQWQVFRALSELFRQVGDLVQARLYGQQALDAAPEAEKAALQAWLSALP